jgi:sterol desaturase/sphingolipid hydroxylase (fatty acid hydroxylase superfamily)
MLFAAFCHYLIQFQKDKRRRNQMNKKVNTALFILGATVFNIIVTVLSFLLLLILYAKVFMKILPQGAQAWSFPIIFITAIVISFFVYKFVLGKLIKKVNVEKYFDPLINARYRQKKEG